MDNVQNYDNYNNYDEFYRVFRLPLWVFILSDAPRSLINFLSQTLCVYMHTHSLNADNAAGRPTWKQTSIERAELLAELNSKGWKKCLLLAMEDALVQNPLKYTASYRERYKP
jgi:hypothetical protein